MKIPTMSWYRVKLPFRECGIRGRGQQLQDAFAALLMANGGRPWDAALFSQSSDDFEHVFYYFSPATVQIAKKLIESCKATQCPAPLRGTVNLAVGDARAFDILWPSVDRTS
jgi:hypothetical protein